MVLIDTHILVWLDGNELKRIPQAVRRRLEREQLGLSPFAELELGYLFERGRITKTAQTVIDNLAPRLDLALADVSAAAVCRVAVGFGWTRDPFDRLLAAHATVANLPLITRDETMRRHLSYAWWSD